MLSKNLWSCALLLTWQEDVHTVECSAGVYCIAIYMIIVSHVANATHVKQ